MVTGRKPAGTCHHPVSGFKSSLVEVSGSSRAGGLPASTPPTAEACVLRCGPSMYWEIFKEHWHSRFGQRNLVLRTGANDFKRSESQGDLAEC
jgi:hypothetical protein